MKKALRKWRAPKGLSDGIQITPVPKKDQTLPNIVLNDERELKPGQFARLKRTRCGQWGSSGAGATKNLMNICDTRRMFTVAWSESSVTRKYRLERLETRLVAVIAYSAVITKEEEWDFNYGSDARSDVRLEKKTQGSQVYFVLNSHTPFYVCFQVGCSYNGIFLGISHGIIDPYGSRRVWVGLKEDDPHAWVISARADDL